MGILRTKNIDEEKSIYTFKDLAKSLGISEELIAYHSFMVTLKDLAIFIAENSNETSLHEFATNNDFTDWFYVKFDRQTYKLLLNELRNYNGILEEKDTEEVLSNQRNNRIGSNSWDARISISESGRKVGIQWIYTGYGINPPGYQVTSKDRHSKVEITTYSPYYDILFEETIITRYDKDGNKTDTSIRVSSVDKYNKSIPVNNIPTKSHKM